MQRKIRKKFGMSPYEWTILCAIALLTFLIFLESLGFDFLTTWDDPEYIVNNMDIRGLSFENIRKFFSSFYVGNYAPLHLLSYAIDYAVYGLNAFGFRMSNLLLHIMNAYLVYFLIRLFSKNYFLAAATSVLFAVHPVQVESVAWLSERKNTLSLMFFLIAFYAYAKYAFGNYKAKWIYVVAVVTFLLAGLTKGVVVILPILLVAFEVCFTNDFSFRRSLFRIWPFILLSAGFAAITLLAQKEAIVPYHGGSPYATFLLMLVIVPKYIGKLLFPFNLSEVYFINVPALSPLSIQVVLSVLCLLCIALVTIWAYKNDKTMFFWICWFFVNLTLYLQIVPIFTHMNERYLYYSSVAYCYFVASLFIKIQDNLSTRLTQFTVIILLACLVSAYSLASHKRTHVWQNSISLWMDAASKAPGSAMVFVRLGDAYVKEGKFDLAFSQYIRAASLDPTIVSVHKNLANLYMRKGLPYKAIEEYHKVIELEKTDYVPYHNIGVLYYQTGNPTKAEAFLLKAIEINPYFNISYYFLGKISEPVDTRKALSYYQKGLSLSHGPKWKNIMRESLRKMQFEGLK